MNIFISGEARRSGIGMGLIDAICGAFEPMALATGLQLLRFDFDPREDILRVEVEYKNGEQNRVWTSRVARELAISGNPAGIAAQMSRMLAREFEAPVE